MSKAATENRSAVTQGVTTATTNRASDSKKGPGENSPSQLIDARIMELSDWRGETLARVRMLIKRGRTRRGRGVEVARRSRVVAWRHDLHR